MGSMINAQHAMDIAKTKLSQSEYLFIHVFLSKWNRNKYMPCPTLHGVKSGYGYKCRMTHLA